jgi:hypothetical protein
LSFYDSITYTTTDYYHFYNSNGKIDSTNQDDNFISLFKNAKNYNFSLAGNDIKSYTYEYYNTRDFINWEYFNSDDTIQYSTHKFKESVPMQYIFLENYYSMVAAGYYLLTPLYFLGINGYYTSKPNMSLISSVKSKDYESTYIYKFDTNDNLTELEWENNVGGKIKFSMIYY